MNEILFKGQSITGEWIESNSIVKDSSGRIYFVFMAGSPISSIILKEACYEVKKNSICQYINVEDKNGNKLWNHDIVEVSENCNGQVKKWIAVIKYSHGSYVLYNPNCCGTCKNGNGCICDFMDIPGEIERIGSYIDQPELLTK